jgi:hypothetical protein
MKRRLYFIILFWLMPLSASAQTITVRHWSTFARTGLRLNITLTGQNASDNLFVVLDATTVFTQTGTTTSVYVADYSFGGFSVGDHTQVTSLKTSGGALRTSVTETIHVYATGATTIDLDNNILLNGTKTFLITPWLDNQSKYLSWYANGEMTNWGWTADYSASGYNAAEYSAQIDSLGANSPGGVIGPGGRNGGTITSYVTLASADNRTVIWYWTDEPDINGVTPAQLQAMVTEQHNNSPTFKPNVVDFYGYAPDINVSRGYDYPTIVTDILSFDNYPVIQSNKHPTAAFCTVTGGDYGQCRESFAFWVDNIVEKFKSINYDLAPQFPIMEMAGEENVTPGAFGPNANQFSMEFWLQVIHGAKSLAMWTPWGTVPATVHSALATIKSKLSRGLQAAILNTLTSRTVVSNQTSPGSRVDVMVREDGTNAWVFAQRLTDDILSPGEATASALSTQITVSGLAGTINAPVFDESRNVSVVAGVFTDNFLPYALHVYQIPLAGGSNPAVGLSPTTLTFTAQQLSTTSAGQVVTLTNTGNASLTGPAAASLTANITLTGTNPTEYGISNTCGASLAANASCTITVTFTPTVIGTRTANVNIADNAAGTPHTVAITGTGITGTPPSSCTYSQSKGTALSGAQTAISATYTNALTNPSLLVVGVVSADTAAMTISDTAGHTWTDSGAGQVLWQGSADQTRVWYALNTGTQSSNAVTVSDASMSFPRLVVHEYAGCATAAPVDVFQKQVNGTGGSTDPRLVLPSITTTVNGDLVFAYFTPQTGPDTADTADGWTQRLLQGGVSEDETQAVAGAIIAKANDSTNTDPFGGIVVAFKSAGAVATQNYPGNAETSTNNPWTGTQDFSKSVVKLPAVDARRTCMIIVGADNGAVLANADIAPLGRQCFIGQASTVVEVTVSADGGTPNVITERNRAGAVVDLTSSALATAASGGLACSNTGGTLGIDGATTCSATLQNTALNAGDWLDTRTATAGGVAKRMSISITYTVN